MDHSAKHSETISPNHGHEHTPIFYVKIWAFLLVLLAVSIIGPEFGNRTVTLITAFGIAVVKALIVAGYFMNLKMEKKFITYLMLTMLLVAAMFFFGVSPDVMRVSGTRWENKAALNLIKEHAEMKKDHHEEHK